MRIKRLGWEWEPEWHEVVVLALMVLGVVWILTRPPQECFISQYTGESICRYPTAEPTYGP